VFILIRSFRLWVNIVKMISCFLFSRLLKADVHRLLLLLVMIVVLSFTKYRTL